MAIELQYVLGDEAVVYNNLINALPAGDNNLRDGIVVPAHPANLPLSLTLTGITANIKYLVEVVGEWETPPTPKMEFVSLSDTYTLIIALPYGPSTMTFSNEAIDALGNHSWYTVGGFKLSSTNYATLFRTFASEIATYSTVPLNTIVGSITSPLAYLLTLPLLKDASSLVPMLEVLSILSYKLIVKCLLHTVGTEGAVQEILAAVSASNPVLAKMENISLLDAPMFRSEEQFAGWEAHVWLPNTELERWRAFIQLASNLPQTFTLKQITEDEVYVEQGGRLRRHVFEPDSPAANTVTEGTVDCFTNLFKLSMTVEAEHFLSFCQATYFMDRSLGSLTTPGADPLGVKEFSKLSTSGRFEQQYGVTPSVHQWKWEIPTGSGRFFNLSEIPASASAVKIFVDGLLRGLYKDYRFSTGSDFASSVYRLVGISVSDPLVTNIELADVRIIAPVFYSLEVEGNADLQVLLTDLEDNIVTHIRFVTSTSPESTPNSSQNINIHYISPQLPSYPHSEFGSLAIPQGDTNVDIVFNAQATSLDYQLLISLSVENQAPTDVSQVTYLVRTHSLTGATVEFSAPMAADTKLNYWLIEGNDAVLERGTLVLSDGMSEVALPFSSTYQDQVVLITQLWHTQDIHIDADHYLYSSMKIEPTGTVISFSSPVSGTNYRLDYCVFSSQAGNHLEFFFQPEGLIEAHYDTAWPHWVNAGLLPAPDGIQTEFLLPSVCPNSLAMFLTVNGRLMTSEQYTVIENGTKVRFSFAPTPAQIIWAAYPVDGPEPLSSSWYQGKLTKLPKSVGQYATGSIAINTPLLAGDEIEFTHKSNGVVETFKATNPAIGDITNEEEIESGQCVVFSRPPQADVTLVGVYGYPANEDEFTVGVTQQDDSKSLMSAIVNHSILSENYTAFWRGHPDLLRTATTDFISFAGTDNLIIAQKIAPTLPLSFTQFSLTFSSFSSISTQISSGDFSVYLVGNNGVTDVFGNYAATSGGVVLLDTKVTKTTDDGLASNTVLGVYSLLNSVFAATDKGLSISRDYGETWISGSLFASKRIQDLTFTANAPGSSENSIAIAYMPSLITAGHEIVVLSGSTITVGIKDGVSTAAMVKNAIDAYNLHNPLLSIGISVAITGSSNAPQSVIATTYLEGGFDAPPALRINAVQAVDSSIYAATIDGIHISSNDGASWVKTGTGIITGICVVSTSALVASTDGAGVMISQDGGMTWSYQKPGVILHTWDPSTIASLRVFDVFSDGVNIYAATDMGLSISTNFGTSWVTKTIANGLASNQVNALFITGSTIYAATHSGLAISVDSGASWFTKDLGIVRGIYLDSVIYAATADGLYVSDSLYVTNASIVAWSGVDLASPTVPDLVNVLATAAVRGQTSGWDLSQLPLPIGTTSFTFEVRDAITYAPLSLILNPSTTYYLVVTPNMSEDVPDVRWNKSSDTSGCFIFKSGDWMSQPFGMSYSIGAGLVEVRAKQFADGNNNCALEHYRRVSFTNEQIDLVRNLFVVPEGHPFQEDLAVSFSGNALNIPTPFQLNVAYYVVNAEAGSFKLSATSGGLPLVITGTGSSFFIKFNSVAFFTSDIVGDSITSSYYAVTLFSSSRQMAFTSDMVDIVLNTISAPGGHTFFNDLSVSIAGDPPAGISINTIYNIINSTATSFQLSLTVGGTAIDLTTTGTQFTVLGNDIDVNNNAFCALGSCADLPARSQKNNQSKFKTGEPVVCLCPNGMGISKENIYYINKLTGNRFQLKNVSGTVVDILADGGGEPVSIYSYGRFPVTGVTALDFAAIAAEIEFNQRIPEITTFADNMVDRIRLTSLLPDRAYGLELTGSPSFTIHPLSFSQPYAEETLYHAPALSYYNDAPVVTLDGVSTRLYEEYEGDLIRFNFLPTNLQEGYSVTETFPVEYHALDTTVANHDCNYPKGIFTQGLGVRINEGSFDIDQAGSLIITKVNTPIQEPPIGLLDGINSRFTLSFVSGAGAESLLVWLDGIHQPKDRWAYSQSPGGQGVITFNVPPTGQYLWAWYFSDGEVCPFEKNEIPSGAVDGSNLNFTLANPWLDPQALLVFIEGLFSTQNSEYSVSGSTFSLLNAPEAQSVWCHYNLGTTTVTNKWRQIDIGICDGVETSFMIPYTLEEQLPVTVDSVLVFLNGINQRVGVDVSMASNPLTKYLTGEIRFLVGAPENNRKLSIAYIQE